MSVKFVDTVSAINAVNGVVRIHFVSQNNESQAFPQKDGEPNVKLDYSETIAMPLSGFLYMASVMKGMLENPNMQAQIEKYIQAGLLPTGKPEPVAAGKNS